jgi:iron complex transport system substrate-binding protein
MSRLLSFFLPLLLFCSCNGRMVSSAEGQGDTVPMKYATLLTMVKYKDHTHVTIKDPWHQGKILHEYDITQPYHRAVVFTSSHCQLLYYLHAQDDIAGVCDLQYMVLPDMKNRVKKGKVEDCGNGLSPMVEKIIDLKADALLVSPFENSGGYGKLDKLGIPIIEAADYMETSALGRAEWMKFYGLLFGKEREADSLFNKVDSTYSALKTFAKRLPKGKSVLTERKTGAVWYCPGGQSSLGILISDAHGGYAFASDKHSGSLPLPFEEVLDKAGNTDIWAFKFNGVKPMSKQDLLNEFYGYDGLKAFRLGNIYECNTTVTPYFEEVSFRPDFLLRELIQLLHPGVNLGGLKYYQRLE